MLRILLISLAALGAAGLTRFPAPRTPQVLGAPSPTDTVHVAPPTSEMERDRASILAALAEVEPGGTVRFAQGTYLVGELIPLATPGITLLGAPDGTVLRGCDLPEYEEVDRDVLNASDREEGWAIVSRCGMFELTGGHVTIRNLTFELTRLGLLLGCCHRSEVFRPSPGGYRIEGNTFRESGNGLRAILSAPEPTVIRDNRFINVFHALSADVSGLYMLDNDISVPEPERVPGTKHPGSAISIGPVPAGPGDANLTGVNVCERNVIAGNRIEGHPDGISMVTRRPGGICRDNVIRENTIVVRRVPLPADGTFARLIPTTNTADPMVVGLPMILGAGAPSSDASEQQPAEGGVVDNLIEGNRIMGAEGVGIRLLRASRNRIVDNTLSDIGSRDPFPGISVTESRSDVWRQANGSAIWISAGSSANQILDNSFQNVEGQAVFLEGDGNQVITRSREDSVRDLGEGNWVTVRAGGG